MASVSDQARAIQQNKIPVIEMLSIARDNGDRERDKRRGETIAQVTVLACCDECVMCFSHHRDLKRPGAASLRNDRTISQRHSFSPLLWLRLRTWH